MTEQCCADGKCDGCSCKPPEKPISLDEARVQVGKTLCANLRTSIAEVEAMEAPTEVDQENKKHVLTASRELHDSILLLVKRLERPRILRPDRRVKVVGPA